MTQLEEQVEFTRIELIKACRARYSLSKTLCEMRVDYALEMTDNKYRKRIKNKILINLQGCTGPGYSEKCERGI